MTQMRLFFFSGLRPSTWDELNRAFNLGFKALPWGEHGCIPTAMQPADQPGVPPVNAMLPGAHGGTMPESSDKAIAVQGTFFSVFCASYVIGQFMPLFY
jgi:hypothetical protein